MQLARSVSTVLSQHFYFSTCTHEATTQRLVQNSNLQEPLDGTLSAVAVPHQARDGHVAGPKDSGARRATGWANLEQWSVPSRFWDKVRSVSI